MASKIEFFKIKEKIIDCLLLFIKNENLITKIKWFNVFSEKRYKTFKLNLRTTH